MTWVVAGLFMLGLLCGAAVRLVFFVVILLGAAVIAMLVTASDRGLGAIVVAIVAVVILQVGYAAGVVVRAAARAWQRRRQGAMTDRDDAAVRVPIEERRR